MRPRTVGHRMRRIAAEIEQTCCIGRSPAMIAAFDGCGTPARWPEGATPLAGRRFRQPGPNVKGLSCDSRRRPKTRIWSTRSRARSALRRIAPRLRTSFGDPRRHAVLDDLGMAEDSAQNVVEVVGDAAGEEADLLPSAAPAAAGFRAASVPAPWSDVQQPERCCRAPSAAAGSSPARPNVAGAADGVEAERGSQAIVRPIDGTGPAAKTQHSRQMALGLSRWHAVDPGKWTMPSGRSPTSAARSGARAGQSGGNSMPVACQSTHARRRTGHHEIGPVGTEERADVGQCPIDLGGEIAWGRVDEAHRDARNDVLECGAAAAALGMCIAGAARDRPGRRPARREVT